MRLTTVQYDTCPCIIEYEYFFDGTPERWNQTLATCAAHTGLVGPALFAAMLEENRRMNGVRQIASELTNVSVELVNVSWAFDSRRLVEITFPDLTRAEKDAVQAAADIRFGPGRVRVA